MKKKTLNWSEGWVDRERNKNHRLICKNQHFYSQILLFYNASTFFFSISKKHISLFIYLLCMWVCVPLFVQLISINIARFLANFIFHNQIELTIWFETRNVHWTQQWGEKWTRHWHYICSKNVASLLYMRIVNISFISLLFPLLSINGKTS
jgi:hypothetical protein